MSISNQRTILYYVHDPMCSWCWGFRPVWTQVVNRRPKPIQLNYLLGGLAADNDQPMPLTMQHTIRDTWRRIQTTIPGTEFNFDFWENAKPRRSTYPACRAVIAARLQDPAMEQAMILAIQKAYYLQAKNPSDNQVLIQLAQQLGLHSTQFEADIISAETQQQLLSEIQLSESLGAQGFPSLILVQHGHHQLLNIDYNNADVILEQIKRPSDTA